MRSSSKTARAGADEADDGTNVRLPPRRHVFTPPPGRRDRNGPAHATLNKVPYCAAEKLLGTPLHPGAAASMQCPGWRVVPSPCRARRSIARPCRSR